MPNRKKKAIITKNTNVSEVHFTLMGDIDSNDQMDVLSEKFVRSFYKFLFNGFKMKFSSGNLRPTQLVVTITDCNIGFSEFNNLLQLFYFFFKLADFFIMKSQTIMIESFSEIMFNILYSEFHEKFLRNKNDAFIQSWLLAGNFGFELTWQSCQEILKFFQANHSMQTPMQLCLRVRNGMLTHGVADDSEFQTAITALAFHDIANHVVWSELELVEKPIPVEGINFPVQASYLQRIIELFCHPDQKSTLRTLVLNNISLDLQNFYLLINSLDYQKLQNLDFSRTNINAEAIWALLEIVDDNFKRLLRSTGAIPLLHLCFNECFSVDFSSLAPKLLQFIKAYGSHVVVLFDRCQSYNAPNELQFFQEIAEETLQNRTLANIKAHFENHGIIPVQQLFHRTAGLIELDRSLGRIASLMDLCFLSIMKHSEEFIQHLLSPDMTNEFNRLDPYPKLLNSININVALQQEKILKRPSDFSKLTFFYVKKANNEKKENQENKPADQQIVLPQKSR